MEFVDREKERARLESLLHGENPAFVVVRGRRRIGKSTLIKKVLSEGDIFYESDKTDGANQRVLLSAVASYRFPGLDAVTYPSWESLLVAINYRAEGRFTLCLDEFPYLVRVSPELPSVIQKLIDAGTLRYNIILCGSSQAMMYDLLHDESSPLYGRGGADFKLGPIRIKFLQEALKLNAQDTIEEYAVWGGIPRYWVLRETDESLRASIMNHVLSSHGILYEEPLRLFADDIKDVVKTATIMSVVGSGVNRLKEIASRLQEPSTNLSRPIAKLVDMGYLYREIPFGESERNAKKSLYRLADPFLSFHSRFAAPNRSFIELERDAPVVAMLESQMPAHISLWWEKICRDAISGNILDGVTYGLASRWWGSVILEDGKPHEVELDVVAESIDHEYLLVGECKWTTSENARLLTARLTKIAPKLPFAKGKQIIYKLFLKNLPDEPIGNHLLPQDVIDLY